MWYENRNTSVSFEPKTVEKNPYPWLLVYLDSNLFNDKVSTVLNNARNIDFTKHDIPTPVSLDVNGVIIKIDYKRSSDTDILARFNKYVRDPIQEKHYFMPIGTRVAIIFDKRGFNYDSVFDKLVSYTRIMNPLFTPICSTVDFSWDVKGCETANCSECTEDRRCSHCCLYKLMCLLLNRRELPISLFTFDKYH
jgi:hypothetical protein